jgi:beta-lactamase superfamily II metal-dependent hydrolase
MSTPHLDDSKPLRGARARIRMYRVGLGDCFLLSVNNGGAVHHMLIDCGMFAGSRLDKAAVEKELQLEIVKHIADETGKKLDVVVITHEHMDHVSIFNSARILFQDMQIGEAWFGWLESETKEAQALRSKYELMETHLAAALNGLAQLSESEKGFYIGLHNDVAGVAEFLGFKADGSRLMEDDSEGSAAHDSALGAAKKVKPQPRAAIDFVKQSATKKKFGSPGDQWDFAGLKVYVLGPPPAEKQLKILERAGTTYDTALGALGATGAGGDDVDVQSPFGDQWRQPILRSGDKVRFDDSVVDDNVKQVLDSYLDPRDAWRRIDTQALDSAPTLALQMDSYINNTSLALAFEFPDESKEVLIFPGDAQVGNWDGWFTIDKFDVKELLKRTIFYKVGHHGSHNATLKSALELMKHPRLVAMMPTNEQFAKGSKHWEMPAKNLRVALLDHTKSRVLRNDQGLPGVDDHPMDDGEWGELKNNVVVDRLFIDYFV